MRHSRLIVGSALRVSVAWVAAAALVGCAAGPRIVPAKTTLVTPRVEVPMTVTPWGIPEVESVVGGLKVRTMIDTGAAASLIDQHLPAKAKLPYDSYPVMTTDGGGNRRKEFLVPVPSCGVGKATFTDFGAVRTDLAGLRAAPGMSAAGRPPFEMVLSPVVFRDVLWTIDYPHGRMTMEEGQSLPPVDGKEILPLQIGTGNKLMIPGAIGGQEVWLVMDTGFSGALAIPQWAMGAFPGTSGAIATGEMHFYFGKGTFKVSRMASDLTVGRHRMSRPQFMTGMATDPMIGTEYLRQFTITIDQRNQRIRLHRAGDEPIRMASEASSAFGATAR